MAGGFFATNLGATSVAGVEGWRCAFHFIAALSVVTAALVAWLAVDPRLSLKVRTGYCLYCAPLNVLRGVAAVMSATSCPTQAAARLAIKMCRNRGKDGVL